MNPNPPPTSTIAAEDLDRLVDGTLSADSRRALLRRIEQEPGAWRRCSIAFLEAQAWRDAFDQMTSPEPVVLPPRVEPSSPRHRHRHRLRVVSTAMAACLVVGAFLLGRVSVPSDLTAPAILAHAPEADPPALADTQSPRIETNEPPEFDALRSPLPGTSLWEAGILPVGFLTLPIDADPDSQRVELPVVTGPGIDDRWLRDQPSFIPDEVRLAWEENGYEVDTLRRLVSVQIDDDGTYLTIPVDEVLLRTVDRTFY